MVFAEKITKEKLNALTQNVIKMCGDEIVNLWVIYIKLYIKKPEELNVLVQLVIYIQKILN